MHSIDNKNIDFVFAGLEFKPAYAMFSCLFDYPNVKHFKLHFSALTVVHFAKKNNLFRKISEGLFLNKLSIICKRQNINIFILTNPWIMFVTEGGFLERIRKKYPNSMFVADLLDVNNAKKMKLDIVKKHFDYVYIYDEIEAEKMGISYAPAPYSRDFEKQTGSTERFDVSYVGQAKKRLREILSVYEKLTSLGLSCKFYIVNAKDSGKIMAPGIVYSNEFIDEKEYITNYVLPARCLLEISNIGTGALTARVREAVMYDKQILSNNPQLYNYKYYNPGMMQIYTDVSEINPDFFSNEIHGYDYQGDFDPEHFLELLCADYYKIQNCKEES